MAAESQMLNFVVPRETFECAICLLDFTDPRNLSCGHVYCLHCIEQLPILPRKKIKCPVCRKATFLKPHETAADLGSPVIVKDLHERGTQRVEETPRVCGVCGTDAHLYCEDCKSHLCATCEEKHKVRFSSHDCREHDDALFCTTHPRQHASLYCCPCDKIVCNLCVLSEHDGHLTNGVKEMWAGTIQLMERKKKWQDRMHPTIKQVDIARTEVQDPNFLSVLREVKRNLEELVTQVNKMIVCVTKMADVPKSRWDEITEKIQHNGDVVAKAKEIEESTHRPGQSLIEMKRVLDSYKSDKENYAIYCYSKYYTTISYTNILSGLRDIKAEYYKNALMPKKTTAITLKTEDGDSVVKQDVINKTEPQLLPGDGAQPQGPSTSEYNRNRTAYSLPSTDSSVATETYIWSFTGTQSLEEVFTFRH